MTPPAGRFLPGEAQAEEKRGISRRKVIIGAAGLVAVGTSASYLLFSQKLQSLFTAGGGNSTATPTGNGAGPAGIPAQMKTPTRTTTPGASPTSTSTATSTPTPDPTTGVTPSPTTTPSVPLGTLLVTYRGHSSRVGDAQWSPHGKFIASGGDDKTVQVWDPTTGTPSDTYNGHTDVVNAVSWAPPNGTRIASGGGGINANQGNYDHSIQVWDTATLQKIFTLAGHGDYISAIKWSPDGTLIASSSYDKTVRVWDASTGQSLITYTHHTDAVLDIAWSPDSKRIASAGSFGDKTVQIWDATTGKPILSYAGHTNNGLVLSVSWSHDGTRVASSAGGNYSDAIVQVWDASTGQLLFTYMGHTQHHQYFTTIKDLVTKTLFAPLDAKHLLSGSGIGVFKVAWSPDNQHIASAGGSGDFTVQVWDASNGNRLVTHSGHTSYIDALSWSPDAKRLASAGYDATVQVWQAG